MYESGVTIGKFWPFHYGHDLMIRSGALVFDRFTVIISSDSEWKNMMICNQMRDHYAGDLAVSFVCIVDDEKYEVDENGTALDDNYIQKWADIILDTVPDATHFVSSDVYGKVVAEKMGVDWFPIDPDREAVSISSTKIKADIEKYWEYIVPEARVDWATKIAIVGPESTGKSTLAKRLGTKYCYRAVPEFGRILSEVRNNELDYADFLTLTEVQDMMIDTAARLSPVVITDTEALVTHVYAKTFLSKEDQKSFESFMTLDHSLNDIHHYFVMAPTVDWVDDGTRIMGDQDAREQFTAELIKLLDHFGCKYTVVKDPHWEDRYNRVFNAIYDDKRVFGEPTAKEFST